MNFKFIKSKVELVYVLAICCLYAAQASVFLWITWLRRFSGNANFFYFQTLAYNAFLVLIFIQVYVAVDEKRKRFSRAVDPEKQTKKSNY